MNKPSWKIRRAIIFGTLVFCAIEVLYLTLFGEDTKLAETIASSAFLLAGSVIGAYVFGAVWDDLNVMKTRSARRAPGDNPPDGFAE